MSVSTSARGSFCDKRDLGVPSENQFDKIFDRIVIIGGQPQSLPRYSNDVPGVAVFPAAFLFESYDLTNPHRERLAATLRGRNADEILFIESAFKNAVGANVGNCHNDNFNRDKCNHEELVVRPNGRKKNPHKNVDAQDRERDPGQRGTSFGSGRLPMFEAFAL